eukprot:311469_1
MDSLSIKLVYLKDNFPNEYVICGYIREIQRLFPSNDVFFNIPLRIHGIIVNYYYNAEQWAAMGLNMILESATKISMFHNDYNTIYGYISINSTIPYIFSWQFRINSTDAAIGIDSSNKKHIDYNFSDSNINTNQFYSYSPNFWGFKLTMQINVPRRTLQFVVDDHEVISRYGYGYIPPPQPQHIDFSNHKRYNMAVAMKSGDVELIKFEKKMYKIQ